ncbi:hypothetical protein X011_02910 [Mycobacterium tuberculosis variant microti OV254]|nr:hypothetical protein X011_02910 [Mycobacterium tuberculosis variant microti OV254]
MRAAAAIALALWTNERLLRDAETAEQFVARLAGAGSVVARSPCSPHTR